LRPLVADAGLRIWEPPFCWVGNSIYQDLGFVNRFCQLVTFCLQVGLIRAIGLAWLICILYIIFLADCVAREVALQAPSSGSAMQPLE
jgi:hypothetical protein